MVSALCISEACDSVIEIVGQVGHTHLHASALTLFDIIGAIQILFYITLQEEHRES